MEFENLVEADEKPRCPRCEEVRAVRKPVQGYGGYEIRRPNSASTARLRGKTTRFDSASSQWDTHWAFQEEKK